MLISLFALAAALTTTTPVAHAEGNTFPVQARLFVGSTLIKPSDLNTVMSAQSLSQFKNLLFYGVEMTYPVWHHLDVGLRYVRRGVTQTPADNAFASSTTDFGKLTQDAGLLIVRVPVMRQSIFKFDVFGGIGGTNTTAEVTSGSLNGTYEKKFTDNFFASPYVAAGASAGVGYKKFFFFVEAGYDRNNVTNLTTTGTVSPGVTSLNLSGPYALVGVLFDGVTATQR